MYLIYNTVEECGVDAEKIHIARLEEIACYHGGSLVNVEDGKEYYVLNTTIDKDKYPIFGINNNKLNKNTGYTLKYSAPIELESGQYAIKKPEQFQSLNWLNYVEECNEIVIKKQSV